MPPRKRKQKLAPEVRLSPCKRMFATFDLWTLETAVIADQFVEALVFPAHIAGKSSEVYQECYRLVNGCKDFHKRRVYEEYNKPNWDGDARVLPKPTRKMVTIQEKYPLPLIWRVPGED